jgi:polysaccharide biosynthesis protein PslG
MLWLSDKPRPMAALAGPLPPLTLPAGVGTHTNSYQLQERELDMMAAAGFKFLRIGFEWSRIEREKSKFDWSYCDMLITQMARHGLRPYCILAFSNPLYEKSVFWASSDPHKAGSYTAAPQHPESVAAYARWAAAATTRFRGRNVIWEIWNEPNNLWFWHPKVDVAQYTTLALAAAKAMRAADPQAYIVGPATSHFDWNFLEAFLKSGALDYFDAVDVHPYPDAPDGSPAAPETVAGDFARLRELIKRCAPAGKAIPILSGEWGYATVDGISLETQAGYIARMQLSNLLHGVPISIWYDFKNDGANPAYNEDNFGTVTHNLTPKPSYFAIQTLTRELSGYHIVRRYDTGNTADFVLVLTNPAGATKLAAWTTGKPQSVMFGSKLKLQLDAMPKYVSVGKAR